MSDAVHALKTAAHDIFHVQNEEWREIVIGLDTEALNWKPGTETNSIAVLVAHTFDATRYLTASAAGIELDRDRESKFGYSTPSSEKLIAMIDDSEREINGYINRVTTDLLIEDHARPGRTHTGAWWLLYALQHAREHIGQAHLTRQLYEQRVANGS